ncbi:hypothetical protein P7C70_g6301, partial [Phenoliferia sp. Uapishka_3]
MGSSASKLKGKPLASTFNAAKQNPIAMPSARPSKQPLASESNPSSVEEDGGFDPSFLKNLDKLGQVAVPKTPGLFRSDNRMLDILSQRRANEISAETPSLDRISAQSLSNLFDECKAVGTREEMEELAKEYGIDLKVVESLGKRFTAPSVAGVRTRKEEVEETQLARWVDPPALVQARRIA